MANVKPKPKSKASKKPNWISLLNAGIPKIFEENISVSYYTQLHGYVVNYCTTNKPTVTETKWEIENGYEGEELYKLVQKILVSHTNVLKEKCNNYVGEGFLDYYMTLWKKYRRSSVMLNKICSYLNENWIYKEHLLKHEEIYQVYKVAMIAWKDTLLENFKTLATTEALNLIDDDRNGDTSNIQMVSNLVNLYIELGLNNNEETDIYKDCFEKPYLEHAERFFGQHVDNFLEHNTVTDYVKKIEELFAAEEERAKRYLHRSSFKSLEKTLERTLIQKRLDLFLIKFSELLNEENDDLAKIYSFVASNPEDLGEFRRSFEKFVISQGLSALKKCSKFAQNDPKTYVTTILGVYKKYRTLITVMFNNDSSFVSTLDKACNAFVNSNPITKATNSRKSFELISKYCDFLLKKSNAVGNDDELEKTLDDVVMIIKYVYDKDGFINMYARDFAARLLNQEFISERIETSMISKLRNEGNILATSKLGKMMNDILISKTLTTEFIAHLDSLNESLEIDFSVQMLTNFIWPYKKCDSSIMLPNEFGRIIRKCSSFYCDKYANKTLNWLHRVSNGEIKTNNMYKRSYVWQVNTFQMIVLLRYNDATAWSISELQDQTQLGMERLLEVVQSLSKASILTSSDDINTLTTNSVMSLNMKYSNKKQRINLNVANKKIDGDGKVDVNKHMEENRKFVTQAFIMKMMKRHKMLKRDELAEKVLDQVKPQFKLTRNIIDKCIDQLLQKQYLEMTKTEDDDDIYKYVP